MTAQRGEIRGVQPGERGLFRLERALGRLRRLWLRSVRPAYVRRMAERRLGSCPDCAHDIVDARDLKLLSNVCGFRFPDEDHERFAWRGKLPFARQGLVEVSVMGGGGLLLALVLCCIGTWFAILPALVAMFYFWFFRDPDRTIPSEQRLVVAPCDGIVDDICEVDDCGILDGPMLRVGISLSLFDVHLNRSPIDATISDRWYSPGVFKNAMKKGNHENNEQFWTVFESSEAGVGKLAVRQIAGPMARTIVNEMSLGQTIARGERFGMIKFGSRTELYFPKDAGFELVSQLGSRVVGGVTTILKSQPSAEAKGGGVLRRVAGHRGAIE